MGRLIDADRLKAHYCWWAGGSKEMSIDEAKKTFDTIIDVQPTVDIDAITETHEKIGFDKGYREGYAQATVDAEPVVRCKNCEYYYEQPRGFSPICELTRSRTEKEGFCAWGKKKDE